MRIDRKHLWNAIGAAGIFLLHLSVLPVLWRIANGNFKGLPPLDMVVLMLSGLCLITARFYFFCRDYLAAFDASIGVALNAVLVSVLLTIR